MLRLQLLLLELLLESFSPRILSLPLLSLFLFNVAEVNVNAILDCTKSSRHSLHKHTWIDR